jgi:hypothetical protein
MSHVASVITDNALPKVFVKDPHLREALVTVVEIGQRNVNANADKLLPKLNVYYLNQHILSNAQQAAFDNKAQMRSEKYVTCPLTGSLYFASATSLSW